MKNQTTESINRTSAGLDVMNLVQRIFLGAEPCQTVTFAGVDAVVEGTTISMEAARVLAATVHENVLLIDVGKEQVSTEPAGQDRVHKDGAPANAHGYIQPAGRGLFAAMESDGLIRPYASRVPEDPNLFLLAAGPASGKPLLCGAMRAFLQRALKEFKYVLIQSPSLASSPDCVTLGQAADGMVLVIQASKTRKGVAQRTMKELESSGTTILGAVLSETTQPIPAFLYGRL